MSDTTVERRTEDLDQADDVLSAACELVYALSIRSTAMGRELLRCVADSIMQARGLLAAPGLPESLREEAEDLREDIEDAEDQGLIMMYRDGRSGTYVVSGLGEVPNPPRKRKPARKKSASQKR